MDDQLTKTLMDIFTPIINEKVEREVNKRIDEIENRETGDPFLTAREAYNLMTGNANPSAGASAVSVYMSSRVKAGLHKVMNGRRSLYKKSEVLRFMEDRQVTGRHI
ncbi:hypothetical protein LIX87_02600 [Weissella viridescens]|uniref:hypothetical protein n=1 Tax=Weissella viridescens TaxID=1629 RepID=UPI001D09503A|nr:hypothetical protein [Weissella viridescens]MCB6839911.1 hypothetical protein [Weissella viridescens]MCB6846643.1 hypothetical protein [Weissella viridescens]